MKRPKFSIDSWTFSFGPFEKNPWPFRKFMEYAADAGYHGIEINGFHPHPHPDIYNAPGKCQELSREIAGFGLGISGYAPDFRDVPAAEVPMDIRLRAIKKALVFCNNLDIDTLRVDTISPPAALSPELYHERFNRLADTWHSAAEVCAQPGVKLVWEFEPGFWLNKPSEVLAIVEAMSHHNFKVLFDTSHAYMCAVKEARQNGEPEVLSGEVFEFAHMLKDHIGHFHLIDSDGTLHDDENSTHAPFGQGYIDFAEVIAAIRPQVEKLEWWCFDFCFCPTTEEDARKAIPFVENLIKQLP